MQVQENQEMITQRDQVQNIKIFKNWIILQPEISKTNYFCSLVHYFAQTFIFVSVESLQPMLFQKKFDIPARDQGSGYYKNAYILMIDIITKCVFAPICGMLSDRYGRKIVLQIGIFIVGISMIIMGFCTNIYPQYCLARIIYAIGAITMATMPLLADYVQNQTKGRGSAINVVLAALGAVFSATVITNLLIQNMEIQISYLVAGISIAIIGFFYTQGLKPGVYFKNKQVSEAIESIYLSENENQDSKNMEEIKLLTLNQDIDWKSSLQIGILAAKNIWILQGYIMNFLGRGDSILLTLSLVIWSQQFIPQDSDDPDASYKEANIKAATLSGVAYTVIMIFAIPYGILLEKKSKFIILILIFIFTLVGCILMNFAPNPSSPLTFIYMIILGIGMSGLYTSALYLINTYAYTQYRGYITGLANIFSVLGIMTCAFIGGILQDKWDKLAPFNLFGLMSLIGLFQIIFQYKRTL